MDMEVEILDGINTKMTTPKTTGTLLKNDIKKETETKAKILNIGETDQLLHYNNIFTILESF